MNIPSSPASPISPASSTEPPSETNTTETNTTETNIAPALHLSYDPAQVAAYLKRRRAEKPASLTHNTHATHASDTTSLEAASTPPPHSEDYSFIDFAEEMGMTDFEDVFQIRGMLESQIQMLGTAFQYLLMNGDWNHLPAALRAQKIMRETIDLMNGYPSLSYQYAFHPGKVLCPPTTDITTKA